ncbi:MAG: glycosyl transferase [Desulfobacteraceae bacterium]|nr:glycosyl transferase [Desulfobacteraceae bacterium]
MSVIWPAILAYLAPSFVLAGIFTPLVRWVAIRKNWVARPVQDRWHKKTTALMGGIAIFAAMAAPAFIAADFKSVYGHLFKMNSIHEPASLCAVIFLGAAFLFALGLIDDLYNIKPHSKLIGQILAAALVTFLGFRLHWFESLTLDTMSTLFWIVGITNAFNLIDNMDGLCAGVGTVTALSLAVLYQQISPQGFQMALILAGAMGGFLIYNFNPAKIFMGDCGSLVIGFSISVLSLHYGETRPVNPLASVAVPILILMVPILDTTLVTVIRMLSGRKASTGGRDHTSHRLVLMGFSEKKAVLLLYLISAISCLAAVYVSVSDTLTSPAVIIPVVLAIFLMGVYLSQLRVYPEKEFSVLRGRSFTPVLMELTYKRHLLLVMLDFILISFSYYLSYRLRFEGSEFSFYFEVFLKSLPLVIGCKLLVFFIIGIYRGLWSFISTNDVITYVRASIISTITVIVAITFIFRFKDFSKGVFIIDWILTTGLLLGVRGSFRMFLEIQKRRSLSGDFVVIYGAGAAGELLLREILNNNRLNVNPVGFIDDDVFKTGRKIQGYPILGTFEDLDQIIEKQKVNGIIISFNKKDKRHKKAHTCAGSFCQKHKLYLKIFKIKIESIESIDL